MSSQLRRVVQVVAPTYTPDCNVWLNSVALIALCDDGTIWTLRAGGWNQLDGPPCTQDAPEPPTADETATKFKEGDRVRGKVSGKLYWVISTPKAGCRLYVVQDIAVDGPALGRAHEDGLELVAEEKG